LQKISAQDRKNQVWSTGMIVECIVILTRNIILKYILFHIKKYNL